MTELPGWLPHCVNCFAILINLQQLKFIQGGKQVCCQFTYPVHTQIPKKSTLIHFVLWSPAALLAMLLSLLFTQRYVL